MSRIAPSPSAVPRLGVLWCPHWPVVAAGANSAEHVAVLSANRVVAHSAAAGADGVVVGQRRREAQQRCPQLRIVMADAAREARQFQPVVDAVGALVARLEVADSGTLSFAARGPSRYFGGDAAMAARLVDTATAVAPQVPAVVGGFGLGVADGRFTAAVAARRAARTGGVVVVEPGATATAAFLAPLSVQLLAAVGGLDQAFVRLLTQLGVHRLGEMAALPAADVLARFGRSGAFAHAVAAGCDHRPPGTRDAPQGRQVQRVFEEPVHQTDTLVFVARQLAEELVGGLGGGGLVCTRLVVIAQTDHGEHSERVWHDAAGLGIAAMVERVRWQLEAWVQQDSITAGVTLLRLEPEEVGNDSGVQLGLWGGRTQADEWATRAVARLATVAGEQQVLVPAAAGGRQPGDAYRWVPAVLADLGDPGGRLDLPTTPWPGRLPVPSPAVVYAEALPLTVLDSTGAAVRVSGRGVLSASPVTMRVGERDEHVVGWAGPWPVDERWWDITRSRRVARFQLLTETGRLLLAAIDRQRWLVVAEWV